MLQLRSRLHRLLGVPAPGSPALPRDFTPEDVAAWEAVKPFTMTSPERVYALRSAVRYVVEKRIPGAIVECGVWRGGSMMAVARTLLELGDRSRELFLFDTFEGMPPPGDADVDLAGEPASAKLARSEKTEWVWAVAGLDAVKKVVLGTGYPAEHVHFVPGKVEDTIPGAAPEAISLLRLDTDWYESTRHELVHLFPRLAPGGVLIIDDYGHWQGARRAVDEYLAEHRVRILLNRIDYTGRIGVKAG